MIEESAMLIVRDEDGGALPERALQHRIDHEPDDGLSPLGLVLRMIIRQ
jgi:hypothetical protein